MTYSSVKLDKLDMLDGIGPKKPLFWISLQGTLGYEYKLGRCFEKIKHELTTFEASSNLGKNPAFAR